MKTGSVLILALLCLAGAQVTAHADEQQNQTACMSDAMIVCGRFIPDRERVANCLLSNRHRVSAACRAQLAHWHG
jgi:hypothetical protein